MSVISYEVPLNAQRMTIGVQGENNVREFLFDVTEWRQLTGDIGSAQMVVQRNGDSSPYATVITMYDENTVSWVPTSIDTAKTGVGKIELMWISNNQTVKTRIFAMKVDPSLDYAVPDDSLDPWQSWMPNLLNADARIKNNKNEIDTLKTQLANPFTFKGNVEDVEDLPSAGNTLNDVYYVESAACLYAWNDSDEWDVASMSESDYLERISDVAAFVSGLQINSFLNSISNVLFFTDAKGSQTNPSITFIRNADYSWSVSGTTSSISIKNIYSDSAKVPFYIIPGQKYTVEYASDNVILSIYAYTDNDTENLTTLYNKKTSGSFTVPANTTGFIIRLRVDGRASTVTVNETVNPIIYNPVYLESKSILKAGDAQSGTDADDVEIGVLFVSSTGGVPNIDNVPYGPGWLITLPDKDKIIKCQIMLPYNSGDNPMYRLKKLNQDWSAWSSMAGGGTTTIVQEVSRDTYNNTYTITTNPTITTDANGWLQAVDTDTADESGKTDMTGPIMSMLNDTGYCHLGPGIFYVSGNIDLPYGATLEGCGKDTTIRLLAEVTSGYCVRAIRYSTVKDICFSGGYSAPSLSSSDIGGRNGLIFIANRDGQEATQPSVNTCMFSSLWFENFDGSGFYGHNSGGGLQESVIMSDCYAQYCKVGFNLDYYTEYHRFTNLIAWHCYYGCINNGGNNVFVSCMFHGVEGFRIDNSSGEKTNNSHGSAIGCTFNHINNWNMPETHGGGIAVHALGTSSGFVFSGCQIWYGTVEIENSIGISFSNCLFGGNTPSIKATGSYPVFFNGCIFHQNPSINVTSGSRFDNCYRDTTGDAITV